MAELSELEAFLKRLNDFTHTEVQKYKAMRYPSAKTGRLLEPEVLKPDYTFERKEYIFTICDSCRVNKSCSKDYPDLVYSNGNSPKVAVECPHIQDVNEPLPAETCWICGKDNCEGYVSGIRTEYHHPDASHLLTLPSAVMHGSLINELSRTSITQIQFTAAVHYSCIPDEEIENE
jgi:hypothetical protein